MVNLSIMFVSMVSEINCFLSTLTKFRCSFNKNVLYLKSTWNGARVGVKLLLI